MSDVKIPKDWLSIKTQNSFMTVSTSKKNVKVKDTLPTGLYPVIDQGMTLIGGYHNDEDKVIKLSIPLIVFGDHTRKVKWIDFPFITGADGVKVLDPHPFFDRRFFYFQIMSIDIKDRGYGRHFKLLKDSHSVLPPLAEQKEIARLLEQHLAQVKQIRVHLEAIPKLLTTFRQSVLADAVSGKLTEEWRGSNKVIEDGFPEVWKRVGFKDIGNISRGKSKHRPRNDPKLFGDKYPFIQTGEVANSSGIILTAKKYYSDFGLQQSKLFEKGTLCITIAANIADTAILGIDACFPDSVVGFVPNKDICKVDFIKYFIDVNQETLEQFAPATAQKNINLKVLNALILPLPSLKEQNEIVSRVEELFAFSDNIERQVQSATEHINLLTQSILAKAFRGELTADWRKQNPELISGDNSAEALLAKIQAQMKGSKAKTKVMN